MTKTKTKITVSRLLGLITDCKGGFTYSIKHDRCVDPSVDFGDNAYAVSLEGFELVHTKGFFRTGYGTAELNRWITRVLGNNYGYIGGWYNEEDNKFYLDNTVIFQGSLSEALDFAREQNQKAIFHFKTGKTISL